MDRIEKRMLASFDVHRIPKRHLRAMAEAVLEPYLTETQVQRARNTAVKAALKDAETAHRKELAELNVAHSNELVDVDDRIKAARERGVQQGKHAMRRKHADLAEVTGVLRETRRLMTRVVSWSGDETWRNRVIQFLTEQIEKYDPEREVADTDVDALDG